MLYEPDIQVAEKLFAIISNDSTKTAKAAGLVYVNSNI